MRYHSGSGISLLEIMLVMLMVGLVLSLAIPGWQLLLARQRVGATLATLAAILRYASGVAVIRGAPVTVCAVRTDRLKEIHGCQRGAAGWEAGVLVFYHVGSMPEDHYEAGYSLRHVLFDSHVRVDSPQRVLRLLSDGSLVMPYYFRVMDRAGRACGGVTVTAAGDVEVCRGKRCTGCE